jgi:hypothetical protein
MAGLLKVKHLTPEELAKIRAVMDDPAETHEKRADAALLLKTHSSLHEPDRRSETPSSDEPTQD